MHIILCSWCLLVPTLKPTIPGHRAVFTVGKSGGGGANWVSQNKKGGGGGGGGARPRVHGVQITFFYKYE